MTKVTDIQMWRVRKHPELIVSGEMLNTLHDRNIAALAKEPVFEDIMAEEPDGTYRVATQEETDAVELAIKEGRFHFEDDGDDIA